jgi:hypothetical protein
VSHMSGKAEDVKPWMFLEGLVGCVRISGAEGRPRGGRRCAATKSWVEV